ncbi:MAG: DUF4351 domain-containing protein [Bryobacteraceae bacterium]
MQKGYRTRPKRAAQREAVTLLRGIIEKRFGPPPAWAEERLSGRSLTELEALSLRFLDATNLEDLLK